MTQLVIIDDPASPENYTAGRSAKISHIVIHVAAGSFDGTRNWFRNPEAHVSAHDVVSQHGEIAHMVDYVDTAWHAGLRPPYAWNDAAKDPHLGLNPNAYTIGIENEGFDDGKPWPAAQVKALAAHVAALAKQFSIPLDRMHIVGHHEIYAGHTCPGSACPLDEIVNLAANPTT